MSYQLYVSLQNDNLIRRFEMDPASGKLTPRADYEAKEGPAAMALSPDQKHAYVVFRGISAPNRSGFDGSPKEEFGLGSFDIDPGTGDLKPTGRVKVLGECCYMRTDVRGRFLLTAYFQAGHVAIHSLDASGALSGQVMWLPTNSGAHSIHIDASNRYVFVPHIAKGNSGILLLPPGRQTPVNTVFQYRFDQDTGLLTPNDPPRCGPPEGMHLGPRHACFHPTQPWFYTINEQSSSVTQYAFDRARGTLTFGKSFSTLPPEGFATKNSSADIHIHKSGRFLYATNRGHNTIASFLIDPNSGELTPTGWARAEARPRAAMLDPTGNFFYAAGFETGRLTGYRIDPQNGTLTELERVQAGKVPMWILITQI